MIEIHIMEFPSDYEVYIIRDLKAPTQKSICVEQCDKRSYGHGTKAEALRAARIFAHKLQSILQCDGKEFLKKGRDYEP